MNLTFQNKTFIYGLIYNAHKDNGYDVLQDPMFNDYIKIGSLLTTTNFCYAYLKQLNETLVLHAEAMGVLKRMTTFKLKGQSHTLKTQGKAKADASSQDAGKTFAIHKHYKVMTSFFEAYEGKEGFNTGILPAELQAKDLPNKLPAQPATLTAFVNPTMFRKYLFQYGYHWKDAGVGWNHGEFTHRIHWYIVIEHLRKNPNWLDNKPIELFRGCALPQWRHKADPMKGVWDDIFDDLSSKDTFRSPETLHGYLKAAADPEHEDHDDMWFLAQLVAGRAAKRLKEKKTEFEVPEGATTVAGQTIMWKAVEEES